MPYPFQVSLDDLGRIKHFVPTGHEEEVLRPVAMSEYLLGGERLELDDEEYDITETGGLVHPDVEVPHDVSLGAAVRIGRGTVFMAEDSGSTGITVGEHTWLDGAELHERVAVGSFAVIHKSSIGGNTRIGHKTQIGDHSEVWSDSRIAANVSIGQRVCLRERTIVMPGAIIEDGVQIASDARIMDDAKIGHHARLGMERAQKTRGNDKGGPFLGRGKIIKPREEVG